MDERSDRVARAFEAPMLVAAVLVIPLLIIEESDLGEPSSTAGAVLNWGTWLAFLAELVVMLAIVPDRRRSLREHPVEVVSVCSPRRSCRQASQPRAYCACCASSGSCAWPSSSAVSSPSRASGSWRCSPS